MDDRERANTDYRLLAAKVTDTEAMRVLLDAGADAATPSADGTTPLMVAAGVAIWNPGEDGGSLPGQEDEVLEAVELCLEHGNDINAANYRGMTALHGGRLPRSQQRRRVPRGAGRRPGRAHQKQLPTLSSTPNGHLVLGNGFSIGCRAEIFHYASLYGKADFRRVPQAERIFEVLNTASSAESVGEFWFGEVAKCVIQSDFQCPGGAESVRPFGDHSGLPVEAFDNAAGELPPGLGTS